MDTTAQRPFYIFVDVDDTFVRSTGQKRIPMTATISRIRLLKDQGAILYCWSSGGADYARKSAEEFGISDCFIAFLPKPNVLLDDQDITEWKNLRCIHPAECANFSLEDYQKRTTR